MYVWNKTIISVKIASATRNHINNAVLEVFYMDTSTTCTSQEIARFTDDGRIQTLQAHAKNVSELARDFTAPFGLGALAETVGMLHDFGKSTRAFQKYITTEMKGLNSKKRISHSIYGAVQSYNSYNSVQVIAEILSNCIASHHGSLRDFVSPYGETPLLDELSIELSNNTKDIRLINTERPFQSGLGRIDKSLFAPIYSDFLDKKNAKIEEFEYLLKSNPSEAELEKFIKMP